MGKQLKKLEVIKEFRACADFFYAICTFRIYFIKRVVVFLIIINAADKAEFQRIVTLLLCPVLYFYRQ